MSVRLKLRSLGALIAGVAVAALAGAVGVGAVLIPPSSLSRASMALSAPAVRATEGHMNLVCLGGAERALEQGVNPEDTQEDISGSGALLLAGVDAGSVDARWSSYPVVSVQPGGSTGSSSTQDAAKATDIPFATPVVNASGATGVTTGLKTPALSGAYSISRENFSDAILMGGNLHRAQAGDLRGLALNSCMMPASDVWLVGSSTVVGTSNRLVVANPSPTSIQVAIEMYTSVGELPLGSSSSLVLPAHSTRAVVLDGIAPEDERVTFHLSAPSGHFAATLQTTSLDGFTPVGIDFIPSGRAGQNLVIPGLVLPAGNLDLGGVGEAQEHKDSTRVDDSVTAAVRIVNPGDVPVTASVTLVDSHGAATLLPGGENVELIPGGVLDLSLDGVPAGAYAVLIQADSMVAAGVQVCSSSGELGADVAWLSSQAPASDVGVYVGALTGTLVVTPQIVGGSVQSAMFTWVAYDMAGKQLASKKVEAAGTTSVALPEGAVFAVVHASEPVYTGVSLTAELNGGAGLAWAPLTGNAAGSASLRIHVEN